MGFKVPKNLVRALLGGVSFGLFVLASAFPAGAVPLIAGGATVNIQDTYDGGLNTYGVPGTFSSFVGLPGDVIEAAGTHDFEISSVALTRTGNNLNVVINTEYAKHVGEDGTGIGSLFLANGPVNYNNAAKTTEGPVAITPYSYDLYTAGRFQFAVSLPTAAQTTAGNLSGNATVNTLGSSGNDVVLSHVGSTFITGPFPGNSGWWFRAGQAVGVNDNAGAVASSEDVSATYSVDPLNGIITFNLTNIFNVLNGGFTLAWEMTCANDVIYASVDAPTGGGGNLPGTPLPATFLLMGTVLGAGGLVGRWRQRRRGSHALMPAAVAA